MRTVVEHRYELPGYFCPACGKKTLWAELGPEGAHSGLYGCSSCHECMRMDVWVPGDAVPTRQLAEKVPA